MAFNIRTYNSKGQKTDGAKFELRTGQKTDSLVGNAGRFNIPPGGWITAQPYNDGSGGGTGSNARPHAKYVTLQIKLGVK